MTVLNPVNHRVSCQPDHNPVSIAETEVPSAQALHNKAFQFVPDLLVSTERAQSRH